MGGQRFGYAERQALERLGSGWISPALGDAAPPEALAALARAEQSAAPTALPIAILGGGETGAALVVVKLLAFSAWFAADGESAICRRRVVRRKARRDTGA